MILHTGNYIDHKYISRWYCSECGDKSSGMVNSDIVGEGY